MQQQKEEQSACLVRFCQEKAQGDDLCGDGDDNGKKGAKKFFHAV